MKRMHVILISFLLCASGYAQELKKFREDRKYGFRDADGNVVVPAKYDWVGDFSEGLALVELNMKSGYIDKMGKEAIPLKYDKVGNFSNGLAKIKLYGRWGHIDKDGKEVIPCKYDEIDSFSNGLAKVKLGNKMGYIDKDGKEVIPCKYDKIDSFLDVGLAKVELENKMGYVDKTGREIVPLKYDFIEEWKNGKAKVWMDGKYGKIDLKGNETGSLKYDSQQMQVIWENLLIPYVKQINTCKSEYSKSDNKKKSSSPFLIKRPYVLVSTEEIELYNVKSWEYSEHLGNNFDDRSTKDIKTLIVQYSCITDWRDYKSPNGVLTESLFSYGAFLVYFDVEKKECIGYDELPGPKLPSSVLVDESSHKVVGVEKRISNSEVLKKIESRLTNSAE